jgi:hypothetical protein
MRGREGGFPSMATALGCFLILIVVVVLVWYAGASQSRAVGSVVPCDDYTQITQKYKSLDSYGNTHYWFVLSNGNRVEMRSWQNNIQNEDVWKQTRTNVTGRFLIDKYFGTGDVIAFQPQNITVSAEGVNFCQVIP